jgi:hypothetical protein
MTLWITAYALLAYCTWNAMPGPHILCTKAEAAQQIAMQLFWSALWPLLLATALIKKIIS